MKTEPTSHGSKTPAEQGSALIYVLLLCGLICIVIGSLLVSLSTQTKTAYSGTMKNESRNAAEGVAEYALAELNRKSMSVPSFGTAINPNPLSSFTLSTADVGFIAPGTGNSHVIASSVAFKNSPLSVEPSQAMLIDPNDPINAQDNDAGKIMSVRAMTIYGTASVLDPATNRTTASYVSESVQVREQSWFNYALFYNMDMEFHAGPNFDVVGPAHTNSNVYATEGGGNKLRFFSTLTAAQKIYRYDKYTGDQSGGHGGEVDCSSAGGMLAANLLPMLTNEDSTNTNFFTLAKTKWKMFVQDTTFNVLKFNPPGLPEYVPEDFSTPAVELRNNAYLMIEPQLSQVTTDADYGQKPLAAENLKFSALSSFVIQVYPPTSIGAQPKWKLVVYQPSDTTHLLSSNNLPARDSVTGKPVIVSYSTDPTCTVDPFNDHDDQEVGYTTAGAKLRYALKQKLLDAIISIPYKDNGSTAGSSWGNGFSALKKFNQTQRGATTTIDYYPVYDRREGYIYPNSATSTTNGLMGAMNVLEIDLGKLNALLNDISGTWQQPYGSSSYVYNPQTTFTGVVYVQFPLAPIDTTRFPSPVGSTSDGDMIRPAVAPTTTTPGYAVLLANGTQTSTTRNIPQLTAGTPSADGFPDGFTVATNGPLYVWGNFNADGLSSTGSSTAPDIASPTDPLAEVPCLIAADSITILSAQTDPTLLFPPMATSPLENAASFTEVSAALLCGLVPTHPGYNNVWSGGVHNLVRYLEDWSGSTYQFRGSIAALFESEVANHAYHEGYNGFFYQPPTRSMGYHQYLAHGRFPPATPIKRTIRRMNLQDITAAAYTAGPATPGPLN